MKTRKNLQLLRITLVLFSFTTISYGILHLFFPEQYVELSDAGPVAPAWIRWFGCVLISLGVAAILIFRRPEKQGIFILTLAIGAIGCSLTLLYSVFYDSEGIGNPWDTYSSIITNLLISILLFISLRQAKNILW